MKRRIAKALALAFAICLTLMAVSAFAFSSTLLYRDTYPNDVEISWLQSKNYVKVTYVDSDDYFELTKSNGKQSTKLYKQQSDGNYKQVSGVTGYLAGQADSRGGSKKNYGTVYIGFKNSKNKVYKVPSGNYAVAFGIMAGGYSHSSPKDKDLFTFTVGSGSEESASAAYSSSNANVLWSNFNIYEVYNNARDYYVMFDLPDCTVTEIETYHYKSGSKAPGELMLFCEDGSEYGPFKCKGYTGQGGVKNAYWRASVNLKLPAGIYAIADSDPDTWSNNGGSDSWGFAEVRGYASGSTATKPAATPKSATTSGGALYSTTGRCELVYNGIGVNPVTVSWDGSAQTLRVSYDDTGDYFELESLNEAQGTQLLKRDASGSYSVVSGVSTRIINAGDTRGAGDYGSVTLQFLSGGYPYQFEAGASYAAVFDIIADGYHHTSKSGEAFALS